MAGATKPVFQQYCFERATPVIQTADLVKADGSALTGTPTVVDLGANGRPFSKQTFRIYNSTASTVVEYVFGGSILSTCAGDDPVVEEDASGLYTVNVASIAGFSLGRVIEIYDASSGNTVLLKGVVAAIDGGANRLYVSYISAAGTPTDAVAGDPVGGPDRYTFATGNGHLMFGQGSVSVGPPQNYQYLLMRAHTGSPVVRVVQEQ